MSEQTQPGRHIVEPGSQAVRDALDGYSYPALTEILDALQIHHDATTHRHEAHAYAASFLGSPEHAAILAKHLSPRLAAALAATPFRAGHVTLRALKVRLAALGDYPTSLVAELRDLLVHGAIVFSERPRGKEMISLNERLVGSERQDRLAIVTFPAVLALAAPHAGRAHGLDWGAEAPPRVQTADFHQLQRELYLSLRAIIEDRLRVTARGTPFKGVLFGGLMVSTAPDGTKVPKPLEFNVRFGDPECQTLMARFKSDVLAALLASRDGTLKPEDVQWHDAAALCVVMAARGYPGDYVKNTEIKGFTEANAVEGVTVFHAGTKADNSRVLATGGRVLGVTAIAPTVREAQARAYRAVAKLDWPEGFCRRDIGWRAVAR